MNGQILARIEHIEQDLEEVKAILKKSADKSILKKYKKSTLAGLWKGLKITDQELEESKKAIFDFDVDKYVK